MLGFQPNPSTSYFVVWTSWSLSPMSSWMDVFDDRNLIGRKAGGGAQSDPLQEPPPFVICLLFSPPYAWPAAPAPCAPLLLLRLCASFDWSFGSLITSQTSSLSIYLFVSLSVDLFLSLLPFVFFNVSIYPSLVSFISIVSWSWSFFVYFSLYYLT